MGLEAGVFTSEYSPVTALKQDVSEQLPSAALFKLASHDASKLQLPELKLEKVDPCILNTNQRIEAALTDPWAVAPGMSGFAFGATAGSFSKHLALAPLAPERGFRVGRAGVIWGLAGFAANYIGGAVASYWSNDDKEETCLKNRELGSLKNQFLVQQEQLKQLSKSLEQMK